MVFARYLASALKHIRGGQEYVVCAHDIKVMVKSIQLSVVTETYPPDINGVARTLQRLVQGLVKRHHQLQLVRPSASRSWIKTPSAQICTFENLKYSEYLIPSIPIPAYPGQHMGWPALTELLTIWNSTKPDVIHVATEGPLGWAALAAAKHLRIPVITDFRTNFHEYTNHYGIGWLRDPIFNSLRFFHNSSDRTLVPTPRLRQQLIDKGFRNVHVVSRGVDLTEFSPVHRSHELRTQWGATDSTIVYLYVGRLAAEKNLRTLVKAFQRVESYNRDVRLVIVGSGPILNDIRAVLPQAILTGALTGDQLSAHYASADIFLFPSLTETYGNVTAEALASGLPVVAFSNGASTSLVQTGINGALVEGESEDAFIDATQSLSSHTHQLLSLRKAARSCALRLSWSMVIREFEQVLLNLIRHKDQQSTDVSSW